MLSADASISMPPFALWLRGSEDLRGFYLGTGVGCRGSRLVATRANGMPAFGHYKLGADGRHTPWAVQVLELSAGRIVHVHHFLDTALFARFGLPEDPDAA